MKKLLLTLTIASSLMVSGLQAQQPVYKPSPTAKHHEVEEFINFLKANNITPEQFEQALQQDDLFMWPC